ncbi:glycosyl hydrolase family 8 [Salinicola avicenniae]|uniref:glycosyl hydrolase family 8 n=1 Tax=Salinicola avicenniae TaxID=2916836 RepID=UPI002073CD45|nr:MULTISPECIES: glycosyl hydrolase family 8 [unclassified Salinicola]
MTTTTLGATREYRHGKRRGRRCALLTVGFLLLLLQLLLATPTMASGSFNQDDTGWRDYRARFMTPAGRIVDTGNGDVSHTEGQGWGMFLAVQFNDREAFDRLWGWTEAHLARSDVALFAWRYDPQADPAVPDWNNASDGDLFMAWALQLAADRWREERYSVRAHDIRQAINDHLVTDIAGYTVLLPGESGFRHTGSANLNLSYWIVPALRDFAAREPAGPWQALIDSGRQLLERARFGQFDLPADWLRLSVDGSLAPAEGWEPRFGFENIRVPLYFTWGGLREVETLDDIAQFWAGDAPPAWIDLQTDAVAPYSLSEGGRAINALLVGRPWAIGDRAGAQEDYYSATLLMLTRVAASQLSLSRRD